jgi:hypothetical protein
MANWVKQQEHLYNYSDINILMAFSVKMPAFSSAKNAKFGVTYKQPAFFRFSASIMLHEAMPRWLG